MRSVDILVTNHNSGDTIALCIESIRKFTGHPHRIIVYDDATDPKQYDDISYLREAQKKSWIQLVEGRERIMHGKSVSRLLDGTKADLAMIMDCDVEIIRSGWLEGMVEAQEANKACLISDMEYLENGNVNISSWFFMLDMVQYPHVRDEWCYTPRDDGVTDIRPTGYRVWSNMVIQKRTIIPIPQSVRWCFRHHVHMSVLSLPKEGPNYEVWKGRYATVQRSLWKLRQE